VAVAAARSDSELLERLRRRDRTAWDEVYRTYEQRLYGFAFRLSRNPHDAADLVQETFVRALPKLDRLPPERANIGAYLFATAKNLFLKQVERTKRAQPVDEVPEPDEPGDIEDDPQRAALLRRQQHEVRIANAKLAPRQRLVLALRELEDKSYAEIGELVGLNENAVAQLISRARQSLREELRLVQVDRSTLAEECQGYLPLLSAHLDGQLTEHRKAETLAHLEACEDCQKALADMEEAKRRYRAVVPPVVAVVALREKVDEALAASGYWETAAPRQSRAGHGARRRVIATVAGLAILGGLGAGFTAGLGGGSAEGAAPLAVAESTAEEAAGESFAGSSAPAGEEPGSSTPGGGTGQETSPDASPGGETDRKPAGGGGNPTAVSDAGPGGGSAAGSGKPEAGAAEGAGGGQGAQSGGDASQGGRGSQGGHDPQGEEPSRGGDGSGDGRGPEEGDPVRGDGGSESAGPDSGAGGDSGAADSARGDDGSQEGDAAPGGDGSGETDGSRGDGSSGSGDAGREDAGSSGSGGSPGDGSSQGGDDGRGDGGSRGEQSAASGEGSLSGDPSRGDDGSTRPS
jgi:RNA polymerase sigma factor (sigma-70 family)